MSNGTRRPGRPAGKQYPNKVFVYLSDEQLAAMEAEAERQRRPLGWVLRELAWRQLKSGRDIPNDSV
jgi:hypothetical protein